MCEKCKNRIGSMKGKKAFNKGAAMKVAKTVGGAAVGFIAAEYVDTLDFAQQNRLIVGAAKIAAGGALAYFVQDDMAMGAGVGIAVSGVKTAVIGGYEKAGKALPKFLGGAITGTEIAMGDTDFFLPVEQINGLDEPMNGLDEPMNGYGEDGDDDEMNGYEGGGY